MSYRVRLTETAKQDLREIAFYIADQAKDKEIARNFVNELRVILAYRHPPVKKPPAKYPRQAAKSYHYTSVIHKPWRLQYA